LPGAAAARCQRGGPQTKRAGSFGNVRLDDVDVCGFMAIDGRCHHEKMIFSPAEMVAVHGDTVDGAF